MPGGNDHEDRQESALEEVLREVEEAEKRDEEKAAADRSGRGRGRDHPEHRGAGAGEGRLRSAGRRARGCPAPGPPRAGPRPWTGRCGGTGPGPLSSGWSGPGSGPRCQEVPHGGRPPLPVTPPPAGRSRPPTRAAARRRPRPAPRCRRGPVASSASGGPLQRAADHWCFPAGRVPEPHGPSSRPLLPPARGPLSAAVIAYLRGGGPLPRPADAEAADPYGDDLQLALYLCYELHYRGFAGVPPDTEWDPDLLRVRAALERRFPVRAAVRHPGPRQPGRGRSAPSWSSRPTARGSPTSCATRASCGSCGRYAALARCTT